MCARWKQQVTLSSEQHHMHVHFYSRESIVFHPVGIQVKYINHFIIILMFGTHMENKWIPRKAVCFSWMCQFYQALWIHPPDRVQWEFSTLTFLSLWKYIQAYKIPSISLETNTVKKIILKKMELNGQRLNAELSYLDCPALNVKTTANQESRVLDHAIGIKYLFAWIVCYFSSAWFSPKFLFLFYFVQVIIALRVKYFAKNNL